MNNDVISLKPGIKYVVTKGSNDTSFQVGDHISLERDGSIICHEAGGWMEAADVPDATMGMEVAIDYEWIENRRKTLQTQLDQLNNLSP